MSKLTSVRIKNYDAFLSRAESEKRSISGLINILIDDYLAIPVDLVIHDNYIEISRNGVFIQELPYSSDHIGEFTRQEWLDDDLVGYGYSEADLEKILSALASTIKGNVPFFSEDIESE